MKKYEVNLEEESQINRIKKEPVETTSKSPFTPVEPAGNKSPLEAMAQMTHNVTMAQTLANMAAMHQGFPGHHMMGFPAGLPHPGLFGGFPGAGFPGTLPGLPSGGSLPGLPFSAGLPLPSHLVGAGASDMNTPKQEKSHVPQHNTSTPTDTSTDSG